MRTSGAAFGSVVPLYPDKEGGPILVIAPNSYAAGTAVEQLKAQVIAAMGENYSKKVYDDSLASFTQVRTFWLDIQSEGNAAQYPLINALLEWFRAKDKVTVVEHFIWFRNLPLSVIGDWYSAQRRSEIPYPDVASKPSEALTPAEAEAYDAGEA